MKPDSTVKRLAHLPFDVQITCLCKNAQGVQIRRDVQFWSCVYKWGFGCNLSLSDTEHGWAHGSNAVYSIIHGLTGTSIELQPCLGMSWYDLDSNLRVCTNKARIYSIKQGLSRFEHDLQTYFIRLLYGSKHGLVRSVTALYD